jgi:restriction endonuclease Mrr
MRQNEMWVERSRQVDSNVWQLFLQHRVRFPLIQLTNGFWIGSILHAASKAAHLLACDGGIDGIGVLQVNPFVSFNFLFQCKRYQGSVTPSQVRDFRGAMAGRADKGIIMTTGTFTVEAKKEARRDGAAPIELVAGEDLVKLFEDPELGLTPRRTFEVDRKFFEEFGRPA